MTKPLNKVWAGALASAIVTIIVWALHQFASVDVPLEVTGALTTLAYAVVAYLVPLSEAEQQDVASDHMARHLRAAAVERAKARIGTK